MDVGRRIRVLRQEKNLSQRQLAHLAGVSNGTISITEKNKSDPSVGLLQKIVGGLGISIAEFFEEKQEEQEKFFYPAVEFINIGSGPVEYLQMGKSIEGRSMQVLREVWQPGSSSGPAPLVHAGEEAGIIIEGRLEVTVGSAQRILGPGDGYYFKSTLPHRFRVIGDVACIVFSANTPPF